MAKYIVYIYSFINIVLEKIWFKLDYIWWHRYKWIKDFGIKNLIDVWANKGQTISKYKKIRNNKLNIYSFEPLTSAFGILTSKYWSDPKIKLHKMWLGAKQEELKINIYSHDDSSSILNAAKDGKDIYHYQIDNTETIQVETLDHVFEKWIDGLCMMKVDVQWYELNVLKWWEKFIKENVKVLILELSFLELYQWQELFDDIYMWLRDKWFVYCGALEQAGNPSDGKPLQQDAYFVNTNL